MNRRSTLLALLAAPFALLFPKRAEAKLWTSQSRQLPISKIIELLNAPELHIWHSEEGGDFVVAASAADAVEVFKETTGPWSQGFDKPCPWYPANATWKPEWKSPTVEHDWRPIVSPVRPLILDPGKQLLCRHCAAYINPPEEVAGLRPQDWTKWPDDVPFDMVEDIPSDEREPFPAFTSWDVLFGLMTRTHDFHGDPDPKKRWHRRRIKARPMWWANNGGRRYLASEYA
jgi:hypothetical protein